MKTIAIIPAAGTGSRMGKNYNKLLSSAGVMPIITHTLLPFISCSDINEIIVIVNKKDKSIIDEIIQNLSADKPISTVIGGKTRTESILCALPYSTDYDITIIHDGARPFVTKDLIIKSIAKAQEFGAAITAVPVVDTIKVVSNDTVEFTPQRENLYIVQTPQAFKSESLIRAYKEIDNSIYTDDSAVYEKYIGKVQVVMGDYNNIKITTEKDMTMYFPKGYNVGIGYDVHKLVKDRKLILGGIDIPHNKGLLGHSDGDCLTHAIMDALLTATNNRDIGVLFPNTEEKYKDIKSLLLLKEVYDIIIKQGYKINNISAEIIAEKPKLMNYIPSIVENLANLLDIDTSCISIAATTSEQLGITGQEKGLAVYAIASVIKC